MIHTLSSLRLLFYMDGRKIHKKPTTFKTLQTLVLLWSGLTKWCPKSAGGDTAVLENVGNQGFNRLNVHRTRT